LHDSATHGGFTRLIVGECSTQNAIGCITDGSRPAVAPPFIETLVSRRFSLV